MSSKPQIVELEKIISGENSIQKVDALNELAFEKRNIDTPLSINYSKKANEIALEINYPLGQAQALSNEGFCYVQMTDYELALEKLFEALSIFKEHEFEKGIAQVHYNLALISFRFSDYSNGLDYINKALLFYQKINDTVELARCYFQMGSLHNSLNDYSGAIEYFNKSLTLNRETKNIAGGASALMGLGQSYLNLKDYNKCESYLLESMSIQEKIEDRRGFAASLNAFMTLCLETGKNEEAEKSMKKGINLAIDLGDKMGISRFMLGLGKSYMQRNKMKEAEQTLKEALTVAEKIKLRMMLAPVHFSLSEIYEKEEKFDQALQHFKLFHQAKEDILNSDAAMKARSIQLTAKIENAKIEAEINHLKNVKLKQAYELIAEKNNDITASITYAKRIQQAKLPNKINISKALPNNFILFKPKAIVSGDFYFFYKTEKQVFIAAVDCTGHGVPGVIMSMIGSEKLYEAVTQNENCTSILQRINEGMKAALRQSDTNESTRDGMDLALCSISLPYPEKNGEPVKLTYAGANRPLWIFRKGKAELEEIKATKKAIGGFTDSNQHFETHELLLQKGDTFYVFSDGYADTFGGELGKKLTTKKFKDLLVQIQEKSMQEQEVFLDNYIENWRGNNELVDDILVIGVRL